MFQVNTQSLCKNSFFLFFFLKIPLETGCGGPTPAIPALGRLRQEDFEFNINLGCTERPYLKNKTKPFL
jgi:hypothetical protein